MTDPIYLRPSPITPVEVRPLSITRSGDDAEPKSVVLRVSPDVLKDDLKFVKIIETFTVASNSHPQMMTAERWGMIDRHNPELLHVYKTVYHSKGDRRKQLIIPACAQVIESLTGHAANIQSYGMWEAELLRHYPPVENDQPVDVNQVLNQIWETYGKYLDLYVDEVMNLSYLATRKLQNIIERGFCRDLEWTLVHELVPDTSIENCVYKYNGTPLKMPSVDLLKLPSTFSLTYDVVYVHVALDDRARWISGGEITTKFYDFLLENFDADAEFVYILSKCGTSIALDVARSKAYQKYPPCVISDREFPTYADMEDLMVRQFLAEAGRNISDLESICIQKTYEEEVFVTLRYTDGLATHRHFDLKLYALVSPVLCVK